MKTDNTQYQTDYNLQRSQSNITADLFFADMLASATTQEVADQATREDTLAWLEVAADNKLMEG